MSDSAGLKYAASGALIGASLSICNVYSGLKLGWTTSMAVTGAIVAHGVWSALRLARRAPPVAVAGSVLVVSATASASAACVTSAGLVSALPALTLMTGRAPSFAARPRSA